MALQKDIPFPSGITGAYIRLTESRVDKVSKEAIAHFRVWVDKASADANPAQPLGPQVIKLRLKYAKFEQYFGKEALLAAGGNVEAQWYAAVKAEPVRCDWGTVVLADAQDVLEPEPQESI